MATTSSVEVAMANTPQVSSPSRLSSVGVGPKLIGLGVVLFVVTRIVKWLPLSIVGSWINGVLWPVLILALVAGVGLTYLRSSRS